MMLRCLWFKYVICFVPVDGYKASTTKPKFAVILIKKQFFWIFNFRWCFCFVWARRSPSDLLLLLLFLMVLPFSQHGNKRFAFVRNQVFHKDQDQNETEFHLFLQCFSNIFWWSQFHFITTIFYFYFFLFSSIP